MKAIKPETKLYQASQSNPAINAAIQKHQTIEQALKLNDFPYNLKSEIISALFNQWNIPEMRQAGIVESYLLNWKPVYFITKLSEGQTIERHGIIYETKLLGCCWNDINKASKVALSFRHCNELDIAICLVKFIF